MKAAALLSTLLLVGCVTSERVGLTPDGRELYRVKCGSVTGGCDDEARALCKGAFTPVQDADVMTGAIVHNHGGGVATVTPVRRRWMLIACGAEPEGATDKRQAEIIWKAEPVDARPEVRCAYWRSHLDRAGREQAELRSWLRVNAAKHCSKVNE